MSARLDRYGEPVEPEPVPTATAEHDPRCRNGWLAGGDNPTPCPTCKPWLVACPTCGASRKRCEFDRAALRGRCCPACPHQAPRPARKSGRPATTRGPDAPQVPPDQKSPQIGAQPPAVGR